MHTVALAMIVKNEAQLLGRCLKSAGELVDEIIVVDTGSNDGTQEIARKFGAKVFDFSWRDDFAAARNFALAQSNCNWNLVLDADEYFPETELQQAKAKLNIFINEEQSVGNITAVSKFILAGQERWGKNSLQRLLPAGVTFVGKIHEYPVSNLPAQETGLVVYHDGYFQTKKSIRNMHLLELEIQEHPQDAFILYQLGKEHRNQGNIKAAAGYFSKAYSLLNKNATYARHFLINYCYQLIDNQEYDTFLDLIAKEGNYLADSPDFHFVCGLFYMQYALQDVASRYNYIPMIEEAFLRSLELGTQQEHILGTGSYLANFNLGVYYEVLGVPQKAKNYYQKAIEQNYQPALERLQLLTTAK